MRQQPKEFYAARIGALIKLWDKCINIGGDYVEKENILQVIIMLHGQENPSSSLQATVISPAIVIDSGFIIRISAHEGKRENPLHYATSCHMTLSYHFTKKSAENTQLWWKSVLLNKLSRIDIAKLVSFLIESENLIKQPPDATNSSDSDTYFSPSPRPQTYGLRPSRYLIPRTLISPPTSI
ncbi:hypothetical protein AVEN_146081-1 [Araneus ventricosus]|uniref:Uncharacterized protein n=1 Tax=Araneus ventricosus TaxID=182803 RepID=A0A4Y2RZZ9_ARAVE|nr:hypothetical protein AVEN_146081-1 [Araneus ventricosus]